MNTPRPHRAAEFSARTPCKAIARHRNIGSVTGPHHWTYMVTNTQLHNSPKDCWAEVKLKMRARKNNKKHLLRAVKKNGTATVDGTGARCWSQHTIHYKGYSYTVSLTRDPGTKC